MASHNMHLWPSNFSMMIVIVIFMTMGGRGRGRGIRMEASTARSELVRRLIAAVNEAEDRGFSQVVVDFRD